MESDLTGHFESKVRKAAELDYSRVEEQVKMILKYRRLVGKQALKSNYDAHKELFNKCNRQLKKILSL